MLKFQKEIDAIGCNLSGFSPRDRQAWRWVFDDILHPNNFAPRYQIGPPRAQDDCRGWGLSFFDNKESAKRRLMEIDQYRRRLHKKLGTHVASGELNKSDGISDDAHENGHFTHFEYKNVVLSSKFTVIEPIYG